MLPCFLLGGAGGRLKESKALLVLRPDGFESESVLCLNGFQSELVLLPQLTSYFAIGSGEIAPGLGQGATLGHRKLSDGALEGSRMC